MTEDEIKLFSEIISKTIKESLITPPCKPLKDVQQQRNGDHDILVEMKTLLKSHIDKYDADKEVSTKTFEKHSNAISALHRRVDYLVLGGFVSMIALLISALVVFFKVIG